MFRPLVFGVCVLTACSDLVSIPDLAPIDVADADVPPMDVPDIGGEILCERDEDCAQYAQCCVDVACLQGRCLPRYVADCCVVDGPCAVDIALHTGTCEATCVPGGCVRGLALRETGCDRTLWELTQAEAVTLIDDQADRVTWHWSSVRLFDGQPTLRAGDIVCPSYHSGPMSPDCEPLGEGGLVRLSFETPSIPLPADAPPLIELMLYADLGLGDGGLDRVDLTVIPEGMPASVVWTSAPAQVGQPLPMRAWTPVLVDLSRYAGRTVRVRVTLDTLDGRDNHHEGVSVGRMRLRTACAADRDATASGVCEVATPTVVHPLREVLPVLSPPIAPLALHAHVCEACAGAETCAVEDACDVAACVEGRCALSAEPTAACCEADPRWAGDGGFEAPLEGWELDGRWGIRPLAALEGNQALHFGTEDGAGLALEGEAARGLALSAPLELHGSSPRWRFALSLATEWDTAPSTENPRGVDLLEAVVLLTEDPRRPPIPIVVWDSRAIGGTTGGAWTTVEVPLDRFAGREVRLGWRFDTVDAELNVPGAVFIDQAVVVRACPQAATGPASLVPQAAP